MAAKEPFNPTTLIELFENSKFNFSIKSGIGFTLALAKTFDISNWLRDQLLNKDYSLERNALVYGLVKKGGFRNNEELKKFIKKIFDKYHNDEIMRIFRKLGDKNDLVFLEEKSRSADNKLGKEINKVMEKIRAKR